jgi:hypothetical protein
MTTHHIFSRPLSALSVIVTFATGIALTATPSPARAEAGPQLIMSDGDIGCPPCRLLKAYDWDGLSFGEIVAEVQDGHEIVITAEVTVTGTGGKPRTGTVVFSAFMDASDDATFMDYTDDVCMSSLMNRNAGEQACAAIGSALRDATVAAPSTSAAGIIMRDGGICDPIRHMGC